MGLTYYRNYSFKNIGVGIYRVLRNTFGDYCLYNGGYICMFTLNDHIHNVLLDVMKKYSLHLCNHVNVDGNQFYEGDFKLVCEYEDRQNYKKIFYLQKDNQKYPITYKENNLYNWYEYTISDLKPNTEYKIIGFEKTKYGNIVLSSINGNYYPIFVNNKVMNILEKYFENNIYKDNAYYNGIRRDIACTYNKKKVDADLYLITGYEITTDNDVRILSQKLYLDLKEIGSYTFYINNYKLIDYKKEGRYNFLAMHIYNNNSSYDNNMILGYEFKEKEYYYLKFEEKLILKNIDKDIAKNFEEMKRQNLYTYLLSNNEKRGMTISIDKDHNITYRLVKINDDFFKSKSILTLDISLLKSQIVSEPCEINHFNGEVEDFDYKD